MPIGGIGRGGVVEGGRLVDWWIVVPVLRFFGTSHKTGLTKPSSYWVLHDAVIRIPKRTRLIVTQADTQKTAGKPRKIR